MELKDSGCYLTVASWHFLELQDSTALDSGAGIPFLKEL